MSDGEPTTFDVACAYLDATKAVLWPRDSWQIRETRGKEEAAAWITGLVDHINSVRNMALMSVDGKTLEEVAKDYRRMIEGETYRAGPR